MHTSFNPEIGKSAIQAPAKFGVSDITVSLFTKTLVRLSQASIHYRIAHLGYVRDIASP